MNFQPAYEERRLSIERVTTVAPGAASHFCLLTPATRLRVIELLRLIFRLAGHIHSELPECVRINL